MQSNKSVLKERQRKALLLIPVVAIPILCCSFYALGGGRQASGSPGFATEKDHFNAQLPDAHFNSRDAMVDKLGFYERADEDSVRRLLRIRADPYHAKDPKGSDAAITGEVTTGKHGMGSPVPVHQDTTAERLLEKLDRLKKIVSAPEVSGRIDSLRANSEQPSATGMQLSRLEGMMKSIQGGAAEDPQIEKLNGMLDKIIRIQHPELPAEDKARQADSSTNGAPVVQQEKAELGGVYDVDSLERGMPLDGIAVTGFLDIEGEVSSPTNGGVVIPGVIPDDQTMVTGATLKLRTQQEASIGVLIIPKNALLYGKVSISGERMLVSIGSVRVGTGLYPVELQVFDMDGMPGIRIPGAIDRDVAKESAEQGASSIGTIGSIDQSIGVQAATAGVQAAKTWFTRKVKLVRAEVKAGYPVLIKNVKAK